MTNIDNQNTAANGLVTNNSASVKKRGNFLLNLVPEAKKYIFLTVLFNFLSLIANAGATALIIFFIKSAVEGTLSLELAAIVVSGILILALLRFIFIRLSGRFSYSAAKNVKQRLRGDIFQKLAKFPRGSKLSTAESTQLALEGVEHLEIFFSVFMPQIFYSIVAPISLFTILSFINLKTAVVLLVCVPLIPISVMLVVRFAKKLFAKYWQKYTKMGDDFLDNAQGMTTLKVYSADKAMHSRMNDNAEEFRKITMKVLLMQLNSIAAMDIVAFGGAAAGMIMAITQLIAGNIDIFNMLFITIISAEFFLPLRALGSAFHVAMNGITASKKIEELLSTPHPLTGDKVLEQGGHTLLLNNVNFSYPGGSPLLSDINIRVESGQFVSVVGESGSGKSTIAALAMNWLAPNSGKVSIDTFNISDLRPESFNKNVCFIGYNSHIFKGSIRDNLLMGNSLATDSQIYQALKQVALYDFLKSLPEGLNYQIEEKAINLSGGQKQRLAIARGLLSDAQLYIFDEATSNIDADSEAVILNIINELAKHKGVLFITHKLLNLEKADTIYVLSGGRISASGNHKQLMLDKDGLYYKLYSTQTNILSGGEVKYAS